MLDERIEHLEFQLDFLSLMQIFIGEGVEMFDVQLAPWGPQITAIDGYDVRDADRDAVCDWSAENSIVRDIGILSPTSLATLDTRLAELLAGTPRLRELIGGLPGFTVAIDDRLEVSSLTVPQLRRMRLARFARRCQQRLLAHDEPRVTIRFAFDPESGAIADVSDPSLKSGACRTELRALAAAYARDPDNYLPDEITVDADGGVHADGH